MSDVQTQSEGPPAPSAPKVDKKEWAERVLADILRLMELPARLELKDSSEGGISVAVFFEGEVPGVQAGRRSHLIEALQFLANKVVNRPNSERRWISIGVGGHPEPRPAPAAAKPPRPPPVTAAAPVASPTPVRAAARPVPTKAVTSPAPVVVAPPDETSLEVQADEAIAALGRSLAEKSAQLGRYYAVVAMKLEDRARLVQSAKSVAGATVKAEGEGRNRRVVFVPDKPTPMPKKAIVDYGDDEDQP